VSNGLGSPTCETGVASELSATNRRHCETSGFVAAPAPTGNYGIDVHIDTGVFGLSSGGLLSAVQDLFVTPLWLALVWAVHALVVTLEWCFTIDLLASSAAGGLGRGLRQMQATFTQPWLPLVLAVASVLALYHGLIRRRVAATIGETLLMGAMMVAGLWLIADPMGTVGALGDWANQAALGTLAVAADGGPDRPERAFATSMDTVFTAAVEAPWCYLEFGDVGWCRDPARLDPRLRAAGSRIAVEELSLIGCDPRSAPFLPCVAAASAPAKALEHSAELLHDAHSNGAIFLALPPNGPARNSINDQSSLLRTICQSGDATSCRGPTSPEAEFRTNGGTWSRVGGLLLIAGGLLGMLLLLGFIALRLLAAAIFSLLYLLLAPVMVLAPACGEGGRALFRRWAGQLLATIVAKLVLSFLLGAMLAVLAILSSLPAIGWWTQWLLMSALWWGAYSRRHQALGVTGGALGRERAVRQRPFARRVSDALNPPSRVIRAARRTRSRNFTHTASVEHPPAPTHAQESARASLAGRVQRDVDGRVINDIDGRVTREQRLG
jgi:TrbL/VirB6 plasmid conjugal transfer protein